MIRKGPVFWLCMIMFIALVSSGITAYLFDLKTQKEVPACVLDFQVNVEDGRDLQEINKRWRGQEIEITGTVEDVNAGNGNFSFWIETSHRAGLMRPSLMVTTTAVDMDIQPGDQITVRVKTSLITKLGFIFKLIKIVKIIRS